MWHFWLICAGIAFILEMATTGFLVFWFGIGALVTLIISLFINNIIIQGTIFIMTSTILIFLTKPLVNKYINKPTIPTNTYSIIGKTGIVTKRIDNIKGQGQVKIENEIWSAKSENNVSIEEGTEVTVEKIDGVKVVVK